MNIYAKRGQNIDVLFEKDGLFPENLSLSFSFLSLSFEKLTVTRRKLRERFLRHAHFRMCRLSFPMIKNISSLLECGV